ncbi:hypothetical protein PVAND_011685 [Polypedilum vanderplanki]|uniref:Uncharacterized protein n=1 Tax=Polypedilum vanderplanki TaxID=319348 RepID=A0A9J6CL57_POLVA|nr:hypothetical protein PVAND_011685 [Polypedilum vanderplanki]
MNSNYSTQQEIVGQQIESIINQYQNQSVYKYTSIEDSLIREIFNNDEENLQENECKNFDLLKFVLGDDTENVYQVDNCTEKNEELNEIDDMNGIKIEEIFETLVAEEQYEQQKSEEPVQASSQIVQFVQQIHVAEPMLLNSNPILANLMSASGISNNDMEYTDDSIQYTQNQVLYQNFDSDTGYAPSTNDSCSNYSFSSSTCSLQSSFYINVIPSQSHSNASVKQPTRGRPPKDWNNQEYINSLIESAKDDPEKLKLIKNNIASGRYRLNKKSRMQISPYNEELKKLQKINKRLKQKKERNAKWIEEMKFLIAKRTFQGN